MSLWDRGSRLKLSLAGRQHQLFKPFSLWIKVFFNFYPTCGLGWVFFFFLLLFFQLGKALGINLRQSLIILRLTFESPHLLLPNCSLRPQSPALIFSEVTQRTVQRKERHCFCRASCQNGQRRPMKQPLDKNCQFETQWSSAHTPCRWKVFRLPSAARCGPPSTAPLSDCPCGPERATYWVVILKLQTPQSESSKQTKGYIRERKKGRRGGEGRKGKGKRGQSAFDA